MNIIITKRYIEIEEVTETKYFAILSDEGSTFSDVMVLSEEELKNLKVVLDQMIGGEENTFSLHKGDRFTYLNNSTGVYILSVKITPDYYKSYRFTYKDVKLFLARIDAILRS